MTEYLKIASYIAMAGLGGFVLMRVRRDSNPARNRLIAIRWAQKMDVIKEGRRYQGERMQILHELEPVSISGSGIGVRLICTTHSGRPFLLEVHAAMGYVNEWEVTPIPGSLFEQFRQGFESGEDLSVTQAFDSESDSSNTQKENT